MGAASLTCDRCRTRLPVSALNTQDLVACPGCHNSVRFLVFPAYYRAHALAQAGERILVEGKAVVSITQIKSGDPCDSCAGSSALYATSFRSNTRRNVWKRGKKTHGRYA